VFDKIASSPDAVTVRVHARYGAWISRAELDAEGRYDHIEAPEGDAQADFTLVKQATSWLVDKIDGEELIHDGKGP